MDKELDDIKDIFVELVDNGFVVSPKLYPGGNEIYVDIKQYVTLRSTDSFEYEIIAEPVAMFVSYMESLWSNISVWYDYQYISYDGVDDCYSQKIPPKDLQIVVMRVRVKKKTDNIFKRFLKKFEGFEYE